MTQPLDFQSIIMTLQHFWADYGCLIWQPYYTQVGAGTLNPATLLRALGPEPWNVAYVEPSIRPDDARYGENPNRMQMHYQFQVLLKPDPGNPQDLYLSSLEAIGINPRQHDIRFVEDNWQQPAVGAWGLGWEVWLDGQEITQYTYFQQAGGQLCDPVSVEMTYGLDRIAISLQRVSSFQEIRWNEPQAGRGSFSCGDVNLQAEQEHSKYYFEIADIERARQMYDLFEAEAKACLEMGLVLPAHDYILKCSHTFNVLDARGVIGVTERQAYFGRTRDLARRNAELYLEQRQRLEYPWLIGYGESRIESRDATSPSQSQITNIYSLGSNPFLVEIGTEELPAGDLDEALDQLRQQVPILLDELRLKHGEIRVSGTPRRQVVYIEDLASRQADLEQVVKGPPAARAFDALGQPTKAAEGFARSKGVAVTDLRVQEMDGGSYVVAIVHETGRPAPAVLAEALPGLIASVRFDKPMRWNRSNVYFSRPIRWLLALYGDQVVTFEYAGLVSGNMTRGLRFHEPEQIQIHHPDEYFHALEAQNIILDVKERQNTIHTQIEKLALQVKGRIVPDEALLAEVANLVETPTAFIGSFDASYLQLPREVLISVMRKHQRYFAVNSNTKEGELLPYFIGVRNGDEQDLNLVIEGNELVIRARFADADFFIKDDLKHSLEEFLPRLGTLTFQTKLGSMLDKSRRVASLVETLAPLLGLTVEEMTSAGRAALLCKADLATKMVVDMTSLQGSLGRHYALRSGESQAVAQAIFDHYLPRFSGDSLPLTRPGLVVGLADRLDTLVGLFAAGMAPTGARDPFALRRTALGMVQLLIANDLDFDVRLGLVTAASQMPIAASEENMNACLAFAIERLRNLLQEQGGRYDVVEAVLTAQGKNPARAARAVRQLASWVSRSDWHAILPAYARCVRITRDQLERYSVEPDALAEPAEAELYTALQAAEAIQRLPGSVDDLLNTFLPMIPVINRFFDVVLVMTEDARLRNNRLGLLQRISELADGIADLSKLESF